jgi:maleylpyruvate isomerase
VLVLITRTGKDVTMPEEIDRTELLHESTQRLVRTVDSLPDDAFGEASALPDWTRGHVVAHLTLNAEGLAGALTGLVAGEPTPMYRSQDSRDEDIDKLAAAEPSELRDRLLGRPPGSRTRWPPCRTTPGARRSNACRAVPLPRGAVPGMRLREVEIHHVDLAAGYTRRDWPLPFATLLLDSMAKRGAWSSRSGCDRTTSTACGRSARTAGPP